MVVAILGDDFYIIFINGAQPQHEWLFFFLIGTWPLHLFGVLFFGFLHVGTSNWGAKFGNRMLLTVLHHFSMS